METSSPKVKRCLFFLSISALSGEETSPVPGEVSLAFLFFDLFAKLDREKLPMTVVIGFPFVSYLAYYDSFLLSSISEDTDYKLVSLISSFSLASNYPLFTYTFLPFYLSVSSLCSSFIESLLVSIYIYATG